MKTKEFLLTVVVSVGSTLLMNRGMDFWSPSKAIAADEFKGEMIVDRLID